MFTVLALLVNLSFASITPASLCETVGPRLDGTTVTICSGAVRSVQYVGNTWSK